LNSANVCSFGRVVYVVRLKDRVSFDPVWDNPTVMGLASFEIHLAAVCAALPIVWPVLKTTWNRVFVHVTFEVSVTEEYGGVFPSNKATDTDIELQSASVDRILPPLDPAQQPVSWEPFVGDETSGLGENETVVESLAAAKRPRKILIKGVFSKR
jgi:hypothetical protein